MEFEQLLILCKDTHLEQQRRAARSVDISLVIRNWLFGWYLVEFEEANGTRAELYGKKLLERVSEELKKMGLKGVSTTNLKLCRNFYNVYKKIGQVMPDQSSDLTAKND